MVINFHNKTDESYLDGEMVKGRVDYGKIKGFQEQFKFLSCSCASAYHQLNFSITKEKIS